LSGIDIDNNKYHFILILVPSCSAKHKIFSTKKLLAKAEFRPINATSYNWKMLHDRLKISTGRANTFSILIELYIKKHLNFNFDADRHLTFNASLSLIHFFGSVLNLILCMHTLYISLAAKWKLNSSFKILSNQNSESFAIYNL
jgi:hypothetical protein